MRTRRGTRRIDLVCLGVKLAAIAFLIAESVHGIAVAAEASDPASLPKPAPIDADRLRAAGFREFTGKHLSLFTDLPATPALEELPRVFDAAVPQWCRFFKVDPARAANWRMHAFLMKDKARFVAAGVLPASLPDFKNGFCADADLWFYEQPTDYYRRHLLLHEGTHGFMLTLLGSCGSAWFSEGVAELAATHRWDQSAPADSRLTLGYIPRNREEVPGLGRITLLKSELKAGRFRTIGSLIDESVRGYADVESYAWCWALATFLDRHPRYHDRFRELLTVVRSPTFHAEFLKRFAADAADMTREWVAFVHGLEYGVDVARSAVAFRDGTVPNAASQVEVAADRGWQSSGVRLEAGKKYRLRASGRYQVAEVDGKPWSSEPGGITIRYYRGRPLGMLLGAVVGPSGAESSIGPLDPPLTDPLAVGLETTFTPAGNGTLYLRVNDSNGELNDNVGKLTVEITPLP